MGKAVFFDLDGTVLDTLEDISDCMNVALKDLGYAPRTYAEFRPVVGNDAPNFMRKLLGDLPLNTLMAIWDYYIPIVEKYGTQKSNVFSGVKDVLYSLKEKGYKLVSQQIRCNNIASLALHSSLGFETDGVTYINKKGNQVVTYTKRLT